MTIDVHAHTVPAALVDLLEREGGRYGIELERDDQGRLAARIAGRVTAGPFHPRITDVDVRLEAMDRAGVDQQILSSWIDLTAYALGGDTGARYARAFNEILAEAAAAHPERFLAFATVPLQSPEQAAAELRHAVRDLGMVGAEIATTIDGTELDDPGLDPFWAAASELRCLVLIHPYRSLAGRNVSRHFLNNLVGNPAETTVAVAHLILGGVLERYPDLQLVLVHGGGFLPFQVGRLDRGYRAKAAVAGANLSRPPSEWLRRLYFDTVLHDPDVLAFLVASVGADHVVLGSDFPFEMGDPESVATVRAIPGLDDGQRALILEGNVRRLLDAIQR